MSRNTVAVVVTYNRKELLRECLESIISQRSKCDIMVIDNASTDGTYEYVEDMVASVMGLEYVRLYENIGGAGGFCEGLRRAVKSGYEYIWIMDDDTIPKPDTLSLLLDAASYVDNRFGFLSSTVLWVDGSECLMNRQTPTAHPTATQRVFGESGLNPVDAATFVSLLFRAETVKTVGLPIRDYFIWGDDKEYTLRLSKNNDCYNVTESVVIHKMEQNSGSNIKTDNISRIDRYYYAYRNDFVTAKSMGAGNVGIYFAAFILNNLRVIFSLADHKGKRLSAMWRGLFAGFTFKPEIEYIH